MGRRRLLGVAMVAGLMLGGPVHAAEDVPAAGAAGDRPEADVLFHQGLAAVRAGDLEHARRLFEASYALVPRGTTLGNLGEVEVQLGQLVAGLHHLKEALALFNADDSKRAVTQRAADDAYAKTGHIAIRTKAGATVSVDGSMVPGVAPFAGPVDVMPGHRVLEARLEDSKMRREVDAPAGLVVEAELEPPAPPPSAPAPPRESIVVPVLPEARPSPPAVYSWWTTARIVGVGLGAVSAAAVGVGISFHIAAVNDGSDVNGIRSHFTPDGCEPSASSAACSNLRSKVDSGLDSNTAAKASWIVAGVAAAGAIVAFVVGNLPGSDHPSNGMVVRPIVGPGEMGIEGRF